MSRAGETFISPRREYRDPGTGRRVVQLTTDGGFNYPLYYYIPSFDEEAKTLVFHRLADGEVQLWRLEVETGRAVRLTDAATPNALWRPWLQPPARGVREYLNAFSPRTRECLYFDGNDLRCVHIDTLADRIVHHVPDDRTPCSLTGVSPDGRWFVFAHADRAWWEANLEKGPASAEAKETRVDLVELATGRVRTLLQINGWITHAHFFDNDRVLLSHPPTERGILITDRRGGWYAHVCTQNETGMTCHYQATDRGIVYERHPRRVGLCNPTTFDFTEFREEPFPITHIGWDAAARLWFFDSVLEGGRCICHLPELRSGRENTAQVILGPITQYGVGQRSHLHPLVAPGREWMLFTGGDDRTRTSQVCLLDIRDLADTQIEL